MWTLTFPPFLDAQSKFVTLQPKTCIFSDRSRYLRSYKKSTIYILRYTYIFIFTDICLMGVFYLIFLDSRRRMVSLTPHHFCCVCIPISSVYMGYILVSDFSIYSTYMGSYAWELPSECMEELHISIFKYLYIRLYITLCICTSKCLSIWNSIATHYFAVTSLGSSYVSCRYRNHLCKTHVRARRIY